MTIAIETFEGLTVGGLLERQAALRPRAEAVVAADGARLTYGRLDEEATALASGLHGLGVSRGDRVALDVPNWPEFLVAYFGVARLGAILVPLNVRYRAQEVGHMLGHSGAVALITCQRFADFDYLDMAEALRPGLPDLRHVIVARGAPRPGMLAFEDVVAAGRRTPTPLGPVGAEDIAMILYTSGTTGTPKGAMLSHASKVIISAMQAQALGCTGDDVFLAAVPLGHVFGTSGTIGAAVAAGASMVLVDVYHAGRALEAIARERITVHHAVPTMFTLELNHPERGRHDLSSLRTGIIAGAPAGADLIRRIRVELGCDVHQAYGLTESASLVTITRPSDSDRLRSETCGQVYPGIGVKILGEDGREAPPGQVGEVVVSGPGVMKGYYRMPRETAEAFTAEGWLRTGDLGTMDERGYLRIVGRRKEMIIRGGFNVYPREIEDLLSSHPGVLLVAVIGYPDEVLGERICAVVQPRPDAAPRAEELIAFCRGRLADFKVPDAVRFTESFPMTPSGKIQKARLREAVVAEGRGGRAGAP